MVERGASLALLSAYRDKIAALENEIKRLEAEHQAKSWELQQRCLAEHGEHEDDGGFMFGSCTRCGIGG